MTLRRTVLARFSVLLVRAVLRGHSVLCLVTVNSFVRAALGAELGLVVGWHPYWRAGRRHLDVGVVSLLNILQMEALLVKIGVGRGIEEGVQVLDVVDGLPQDPHLAELAHSSCPGDLEPQALKTFVDRLHPAPLSLVPLDRLQVLLGFDLVPMDWVEHSHRLSSTHFYFRASCSAVCEQLTPRNMSGPLNRTQPAGGQLNSTRWLGRDVGEL